MKQNTKRNLIVAFSTLALIANSWSATAARAVGSGLVFPTLNHSLQQNPAGLAESPSGSLQGLYDFDSSNIFGSAMIGQNGFGAGFSYLHIDAASTSQEAFGAGAKLGNLMLGAALQSQEFAGFSLDAGAIFELSSLRAGVVVRQVTDGVSSIEGGIGISKGMWGAEFDVFKPVGNDLLDDFWGFNAGLHARLQQISLGFGYTFAMIGSDFQDGNIWAGLSFSISNNLAIEGFYNGGESNIGLGELSAGVRMQF